VTVASVQADPEDPTGERVGILDVVHIGENFDEDFLEEIFGGRPVIGIPESEIEKSGFKTPVDFFHGRRFPGLTADNQFAEAFLAGFKIFIRRALQGTAHNGIIAEFEPG
jgi:hypothetical protein